MKSKDGVFNMVRSLFGFRRPSSNRKDVIVTVELAGVRACYVEGDYPLTHILTNPHAKIVHDVQPLAPPRDIDFRTYGDAPGGDVVSIMMAHLWRHDIPFAYLDIGANVGITIAFAASFMLRCGRPTSIYGFEPGDAFRSLPSTIIANGIQDWAEVFNVALSNEVGRLALHQIDMNSSAGSLLSEISTRAGNNSMSHRTVEVTTIDAFVKKRGLTSNFVAKIDTEGADLKVVWGARATMASHLMPMILEFTPSLIRAYCDPAEELEKLSPDLIFMDERRRGVPIQDFRAYVESVESYTDLIALPRRLPDVEGLVHRLGTH